MEFEVNLDETSKNQAKPISHEEWVARTNAGRDATRFAFLGHGKNSWKVKSLNRKDLGPKKRYITPSGNKGRYGWEVTYIGKTQYTRPEWFISERLVDRHGLNPTQAEAYRVVKSGDVYVIGENDIQWGVEQGIIAKYTGKLSKRQGAEKSDPKPTAKATPKARAKATAKAETK